MPDVSNDNYNAGPTAPAQTWSAEQARIQQRQLAVEQAANRAAELANERARRRPATDGSKPGFYHRGDHQRNAAVSAAG